MKLSMLALGVLALGVTGCDPVPKAVSENSGGQKSETTPTDPPKQDPPKTDLQEEDKPVKIDTSKAPHPPVVLKRSNKFDWAPTIQEGVARARKKAGYALVVFQAPWSGQCIIMNREAFHDESIAKLFSRAVIVPIDVDTKEGQKLSEQYKAEEIPTFVFLGPDGKEMGGFFGYMNVEWLKRETGRMFDRAKIKKNSASPAN